MFILHHKKKIASNKNVRTTNSAGEWKIREMKIKAAIHINCQSPFRNIAADSQIKISM